MSNDQQRRNYDRNDHDREDLERLLTRSVKAGRRTYYVDVKQDRKGEYYIALTESKRVKAGTDTEPPVFEKHKVFIYREDIVNFLTAFTECAEYISTYAPLTPHERIERPDTTAPDSAETPDAQGQDFKTDTLGDFDVDF